MMFLYFLINKLMLKLEICVACRKFLAFKYVVIIFFKTKRMIIYFYLYIRNLENLPLKPVFGTQYSFVFVLAGRGY